MIPFIVLASTISRLNLSLSSSHTTSPNCCRTSRLVVDEYALKWLSNEKKILLLLKQFDNIFVLKFRSFFRDAK